MDNLRQAHRIRSAIISSETATNEEKIINLQLAKSKLEASITKRTEEAQTVADGAVKKVQLELEAIETMKTSTQNDMVKLSQWKNQSQQSQKKELNDRMESSGLRDQNKEKVYIISILQILNNLILYIRWRCRKV